MQIKAAVKDHFTPIRSMIPKKLKIASVGRDVKKWEPLCFAAGHGKAVITGKPYGGSSEN